MDNQEGAGGVREESGSKNTHKGSELFSINVVMTRAEAVDWQKKYEKERRDNLPQNQTIGIDGFLRANNNLGTKWEADLYHSITKGLKNGPRTRDTADKTGTAKGNSSSRANNPG